MVDGLPVRNENGLLNLYGTSDSLFERALVCVLRLGPFASDRRDAGFPNVLTPANAALISESNASSAEVVFPCWPASFKDICCCDCESSCSGSGSGSTMMSSMWRTLRNGEPPFIVFIVGESRVSSDIPISSAAGVFSTLSFVLFFFGVLSSSSFSSSELKDVRLVRLDSVGDSRLLVLSDWGDFSGSSSESSPGVDKPLVT